MCFLIDKCCFCISLSSGARIISVLSLVASMAMLTVYGGAAWASPSTMTHGKFCFYIFVSAVSVCKVFSSILLIYGVFWTKPRFLWPWLVISWLSCAGLLSLSILGVVLLTVQYYDDVETSAEVSTTSSIYFVNTAIIYYFATVINSRRMQMIRQQELELTEKNMRQKDFKNLLA